MKIHGIRAEIFHARWRTGGQTLTHKYDEVNGRFSQLCQNATKKKFFLPLFCLKKDVNHYPKHCNIFIQTMYVK